MSLGEGPQHLMDKPLRKCLLWDCIYSPVVLSFMIDFLTTHLIFCFVHSNFGRESVLEHLVRRVQCRGLFSTHYHRLAIDYLKDPKVYPDFYSV